MDRHKRSAMDFYQLAVKSLPLQRWTAAAAAARGNARGARRRSRRTPGSAISCSKSWRRRSRGAPTTGAGTRSEHAHPCTTLQAYPMFCDERAIYFLSWNDDASSASVVRASTYSLDFSEQCCAIFVCFGSIQINIYAVPSK